MLYREAIDWLIDLQPRAIMVTGPQRSGTTIIARALAEDLGMLYIDEDDVGWISASVNDDLCLADLFDTEEYFVVQSPACAHICHEIGQDVSVAIVFVMRSIADIVASQERIGWQYEDVEFDKYPEDMRLDTIAATKYAFWDEVQRSQIANPIEIEYESLAGHPIWVPQKERKDWAAREWE